MVVVVYTWVCRYVGVGMCTATCTCRCSPLPLLCYSLEPGSLTELGAHCSFQIGWQPANPRDPVSTLGLQEYTATSRDLNSGFHAYTGSIVYSLSLSPEMACLCLQKKKKLDKILLGISFKSKNQLGENRHLYML